MRLHAIEIRDFRKLAGEWRIGPLGSGLTVIGGDNEEGKSTVLLALKAALFEHHAVGGRVREAMTAYGGGVPRVAVELELAGARYRLEKEFGRSCTLTGPEGRLQGDRAEDRLVELLRFARRQGRAERRPEHQGLLALFWVDQGTSFREEATSAAIEAQRDRLRAVLRHEIGMVAGGPRLAPLRARIESQYARFWTERGQPKKAGELATLQGEIARLEEERRRLQEARRRYDETVDRLARARAERARAESPERLERARERRGRAVEERTLIERLERDRAVAAKAVEAASAELGRIEEDLRARAEQRANLARDEAQLRALEEERSRLAGRLGEAEARLLALEKSQASATEAAVAARKRLALAQAARELVARQAEAERLRAVLTEAEERAATIARETAELETLRIDESGLRRLRELVAERDRREAGLLAQATRVELLPEPGRLARLEDGTPIDPGRPLDLTAPTELRLDGFGRIRVAPGGDLAARRQALAEARTRIATALAELGVESPAAAEEALARRRALAQKLAEERRALEGLLRGTGVVDLEALRARLQVELRRLETGRQSLGEGAEPERLAATLEAAAREVEEAERALETRRAEAAAAGKALAGAREQAAGLEGRRRELLRAVEAARAALLAAEARCPDGELEARRGRAAEALATARANLAAIEAELARRDAEGVRAREAQAEREIAALEAEIARCRQEVDRLEGEVRGLGIEACDSRLDELERALEALSREERALAREAAAWRLLRESLALAERAGTERLTEPVRERFVPYLRRLLPDAEPVIDAERLVPTHLRRGGIDEPLAELSVGTREQIAVLVRLALGDLLLEREGEAPCLILDDALVFADEARFERMQAILGEAAARRQILILTCRPRDWMGVPGPRIRLETCRRTVPG